MVFFRELKILLEMIKIEHTVFALPFAFMGALLGARGLPTAPQAFYILVAMVGARSAAMAFNRLVDAPLDAANPRTADRALPRGLISRRATVAFIVLNSLLFLWAAGRLNPLCRTLAPFALLVVFFYSYTKRFTWTSHFFLGAALGLAPLGGWIAVTGEVALLPLILGAAVLLWVAGFDVLYSLQDVEFDRRAGLFSLPASLGPERSMKIARLLHLGAAAGFVATGWLAGLGRLYLAAALAAGLFLWWEHRLITPHDLSRLHQAFFTLNGLIGILLGLATLFSLWP
ncbi:MAG: UbiA family prenyltransferase [Deltaproteobacteria bacterium]|nr:UbiA family prenyltransferase [Deltaproteobacteria bacterium]